MLPVKSGSERALQANSLIGHNFRPQKHLGSLEKQLKLEKEEVVSGSNFGQLQQTTLKRMMHWLACIASGMELKFCSFKNLQVNSIKE